MAKTTKTPAPAKPDLLGRYRPIGIAAVLAAAKMVSHGQTA